MEEINNLIIVAHPDDEAFWFNPILKKPGTAIIICSQNVYSLDESSMEYATKVFEVIKKYREELGIDVLWLEIMKTARVFHKADKRSAIHFKESLISLISMLKPKQIYTHNPWGEYGHTEHMLVHKVLKDLRKDIIFPGIAIKREKPKGYKGNMPPPPDVIGIARSYSDKLKLFSIEQGDVTFMNKVLRWYGEKSVGKDAIKYFGNHPEVLKDEQKFYTYK